jgi:hypothetical protein
MRHLEGLLDHRHAELAGHFLPAPSAHGWQLLIGLYRAVPSIVAPVPRYLESAMSRRMRKSGARCDERGSRAHRLSD